MEVSARLPENLGFRPGVEDQSHDDLAAWRQAVRQPAQGSSGQDATLENVAVWREAADQPSQGSGEQDSVLADQSAHASHPPQHHHVHQHHLSHQHHHVPPHHPAEAETFPKLSFPAHDLATTEPAAPSAAAPHVLGTVQERQADDLALRSGAGGEFHNNLAVWHQAASQPGRGDGGQSTVSVHQGIRAFHFPQRHLPIQHHHVLHHHQPAKAGTSPSPGSLIQALAASKPAAQAAPAPATNYISGTVQDAKAVDPAKGKHLSEADKEALRNKVAQATVNTTLQLLQQQWNAQPSGEHQAVWAGIKIRNAHGNTEALLVRIDAHGHCSAAKVDNVRKQEAVDEAVDRVAPGLQAKLAAAPGHAEREAVQAAGSTYLVSIEVDGTLKVEKTKNVRDTTAVDDALDALAQQMAATPPGQRHKLSETITVAKGDKWNVSLTVDGKEEASKKSGFWGSLVHVVESIVTPIVDVAAFIPVLTPVFAPIAIGLDVLGAGQQIADGDILGGVLGLAGAVAGGLGAIEKAASKTAEAAKTAVSQGIELAGKVGKELGEGVAVAEGARGVVQGAEHGSVLAALTSAAQGVAGSGFASDRVSSFLNVGSTAANGSVAVAHGDWMSAFKAGSTAAIDSGLLHGIKVEGQGIGPSARQFWSGQNDVDAQQAANDQAAQQRASQQQASGQSTAAALQPTAAEGLETLPMAPLVPLDLSVGVPDTDGGERAQERDGQQQVSQASNQAHGMPMTGTFPLSMAQSTNPQGSSAASTPASPVVDQSGIVPNPKAEMPPQSDESGSPVYVDRDEQDRPIMATSSFNDADEQGKTAFRPSSLEPTYYVSYVRDSGQVIPLVDANLRYNGHSYDDILQGANSIGLDGTDAIQQISSRELQKIQEPPPAFPEPGFAAGSEPQRVDLYAASVISDLQNSQGSVIGDWSRVGDDELPKLGLAPSIFMLEDGSRTYLYADRSGHYMLPFAGTATSFSFTTLMDWETNINNGLPMNLLIPDPQIMQAARLGKTVCDALGSSNVMPVGTSLGAAKAQAAGLACGSAWVIFNGEGLKLGTPWTIEVSLGNNLLDESALSVYSRSYQVDTQALAYPQTVRLTPRPLGDEIKLPVPQSYVSTSQEAEQARVGDYNPAYDDDGALYWDSVKKAVVQKFDMHSIDETVKAIAESGLFSKELHNPSP